MLSGYEFKPNKAFELNRNVSRRSSCLILKGETLVIYKEKVLVCGIIDFSCVNTYSQCFAVIQYFLPYKLAHHIGDAFTLLRSKFSYDSVSALLSQHSSHW